MSYFLQKKKKKKKKKKQFYNVVWYKVALRVWVNYLQMIILHKLFDGLYSI